MGIELELYILLVFLILGSSIFAVFEVETARWRKVLKWLIVCGGTVGLYYAVGHVALVFPIGAGTIGTAFHFWWCRKHNIDPIHATPRSLSPKKPNSMMTMRFLRPCGESARQAKCSRS